MNLQDMFELEIEGIANTIQEYAVEHFIQSYANQLRRLSLPNDHKKASILIDRLLTWYQTHIEDIDNSRFILNKEEHHKSYSLLLELHNLLY